jgi:hypothetical protein
MGADELVMALSQSDKQNMTLSITHVALKKVEQPSGEEAAAVVAVLTSELGGTLTNQENEGATWSIVFPAVSAN